MERRESLFWFRLAVEGGVEPKSLLGLGVGLRL